MTSSVFPVISCPFPPTPLAIVFGSFKFVEQNQTELKANQTLRLSRLLNSNKQICSYIKTCLFDGLLAVPCLIKLIQYTTLK